MKIIAFGRKAIAGDDKFMIPDIPPSTKGEALEKDLMLYSEIKAVLPYMWEERTQDKSVVYFYGVPVLAMDIEDGKIEKVYKKQEQVEKIAQGIKNIQSERRLLAGTIYGLAKDINTGEAYCFRRNVGHYDIVKRILVGSLRLTFDEDYQNVRRSVLKGEEPSYVQFLEVQNYTRENISKVSSELYKALIVSDKNGNEFLKNPFDIPKTDKVFIFLLKAGEEQRVLITNTREYRVLTQAYAERIGLEKEKTVSLTQFPYITEIAEGSEFVRLMNEFFSKRKRFEKEGDKTFPVNEKAEEFFNTINALTNYLYTGQIPEIKSQLDEKVQERIAQGMQVGIGKEEYVLEEENTNLTNLDELEELIEEYLKKQLEVGFFQGR